MTESRNNLIVFSVHVPKTGGTSFLKLLEQHYGNGMLLDNGVSKQDVLQKISAGGISCVHGHYYAQKYADVKGA